MPAGFYVTVCRARRVGFLVGPYASEPLAREQIPAARRAAEAVDPFTCFDAFGTAKVTADKLSPGVLNERVGYQEQTECLS